MLRIVILIIVFALVTWFLYRKVYKFLVTMNKELSDEPSFEDRKFNIELEGEKFDEDLRQREIELSKESRKLKRFKAERNRE